MAIGKKTTMELKNYNVYFFFVLLLLVSAATFLIFQPFVIALFLAAILAALFQGTYDFFLRIFGDRKSLSSFATSVTILLIIVLPLTAIFLLVGNEITSFYRSVSGSGDFYLKYLQPIVFKIQANAFFQTLNLGQLLSQETFLQYSGQAGQLLLGLVQKTYQSIAHALFMIFLMFFSLYYFFMDGKRMVRKIMYISPLKDVHEKLLIAKFVSMSRATIKGTLLLGFLQGLLGAVSFLIAGVPSAVTWGVAMMVFSLIPLFGSGIVWLPVGLILLLSGQLWQGIFVLVFGFAIISTMDNFLRPKFVGKDTQMHPLAVFCATLGGLSIFGFTGFIIGPVIVALFLSLWDIYGVEFKTQLKKYNA